MSFQNILVIKLRHIGDVLLSTPVLHEIRQAYPSARLTILLNRGTEAIAGQQSGFGPRALRPEGAARGADREFLRQQARLVDCVID
ncbi:MAG: hypothetical protein U0361_21130 [Nitrospiraceae bacterium]